MELEEIYKQAKKLERQAYIQTAKKINEILIQNSVYKYTIGYDFRTKDGKKYNDWNVWEKTDDLVRDYEMHFGMFDPQITFEDGNIYNPNYDLF